MLWLSFIGRILDRKGVWAGGVSREDAGMMTIALMRRGKMRRVVETHLDPGGAVSSRISAFMKSKVRCWRPSLIVTTPVR